MPALPPLHLNLPNHLENIWTNIKLCNKNATVALNGPHCVRSHPASRWDGATSEVAGPAGTPGSAAASRGTGWSGSRGRGAWQRDVPLKQMEIVRIKIVTFLVWVQLELFVRFGCQKKICYGNWQDNTVKKLHNLKKNVFYGIRDIQILPPCPTTKMLIVKLIVEKVCLRFVILNFGKRQNIIISHNI